ncbi:hypothetical protein G9P44_004030 [Scheffersomyces stipitis]|nr:hypothetical protein G9P44_004030 [Scheffersomyces stipitis]
MRYSTLTCLALISTILNGFPISGDMGGKNARGSYSEGKDFFDPNPGAKGEPPVNTIKVSTLDGVLSKYGYLLESENEEQFLFHIIEDNSFLVRAHAAVVGKPTTGPNSPVQNLDDITKRGIFRKKKKNNKQANQEKQVAGKANEKRFDWVHFTYEDEEVTRYPHIPISACQSQEFGQEGSISFSYAFSSTLHSKHNFDVTFSITYMIFSVALGMKMSVELTSTREVSGTTTCNLKAGQVGQIWASPVYASAKPKTRLLQWRSDTQEFLTLSEFKVYERLFALMEHSILEIECVTSDIARLECTKRPGDPYMSSLL